MIGAEGGNKNKLHKGSCKSFSGIKHRFTSQIVLGIPEQEHKYKKTMK